MANFSCKPGRIRTGAGLVSALFLPLVATVALAMDDHGLEGSEWWVEDIGGRGVVDRSHTTLEFLGEGKIAGDTSCNRYMGPVEIGDHTMKFGAIAGTRRACAPALMNQEQGLFEALQQVESWELPPTGLLHLNDANGNTVIRAWRVEKK